MSYLRFDTERTHTHAYIHVRTHARINKYDASCQPVLYTVTDAVKDTSTTQSIRYTYSGR